MSDWLTREIPDNAPLSYFKMPNDRAIWAIYNDICQTMRHIAFLPPDREAQDAESLILNQITDAATRMHIRGATRSPKSNQRRGVTGQSNGTVV
jgi:hypothetical protein